MPDDREVGRITNVPGEKAKAARAVNALYRKASRDRQKALVKALSESEVKDRLQLTEKDIDTLNNIIRSPGRNAIAQLAALKLKAQFTISQPKPEGSGDGGPISVTVNTLTYPDKQPVTVTVTQTQAEPQREDDDAEQE